MAGEAKSAGAFVRRKVGILLSSRNESATRAMLARLRRGIGKPPGSIPELWSVTLDELPEPLKGISGGPTKGEWAVYTALTLFALHQQGKELKGRPMHSEGESLGASVRRLVRNDDDEARIKRRFDAAATSDSPEEFSSHLRGLIQLLKADDIPLDYAAMAEDLYLFQISDAWDSVRLRWGRDFYRVSNKEIANQEGSSNGKDENHENE
jgi:CRISPR system Cascade subunit CasB